MRTPQDVRTVAIVGTGAIGSSWAAFALDRGLTVVATDPAPGASQALDAAVATRLSDLTDDIGHATAAGLAGWRARLHFTPDLEEAAAQADLVLENGPERLEVKRRIFAALDAAADPEVILASSSSGLAPSDFQDACARHPQRVLVAHPFNPPHLVPLVEIVGGRRTAPETIDAAMALFRHWGKRPVHIRRELPGHIANRLQAALWREAYHLVALGAATVADVDAVIAAGPGLRWALLGPLATQHLSGGPGGMAHVLEHLGPPMVDWWADLGHPELTPELVETLVAGVAEELADRPAPRLLAERDRALRELLALKDRHGLA